MSSASRTKLADARICTNDAEGPMVVTPQDGPTPSRIEQVHEEIRAAIISGRYQPRERLTESDLAQTFGTSRQTVRAALIRLEEQGLVVLEPNRGASVRSFSVPDAIRIMRLRELLEGFAAALAAEKATNEELAELRGLVQKMRTCHDAGDLIGYSALNDPFHKLVVKAARDEQVENFVTSLNYVLVRFQFRSILVPGRADSSLHEHERIVECLVSRDGPGAEAAMRKHISHARTALEQTTQMPM